MPNPFSLERNTPKPSSPRVPCTPKRGYAHHTIYEDPAHGQVVGRCLYCRRKFVKRASLTTYEVWAAGATLTDPLPKRTVAGQTSDYR